MQGNGYYGIDIRKQAAYGHLLPQNSSEIFASSKVPAVFQAFGYIPVSVAVEEKGCSVRISFVSAEFGLYVALDKFVQAICHRIDPHQFKMGKRQIGKANRTEMLFR